MESYKDFNVYKDSRRLNWLVYRLTTVFPATEKYALADQLRRACVSITSNIAEGYGQGSLRNRVRYLYMARGSLYEAETQLLVATDLGFVNAIEIQEVFELVTKMAKMLNGLIRSNEERIKSGTPARISEETEMYGMSGCIEDSRTDLCSEFSHFDSSISDF